MRLFITHPHIMILQWCDKNRGRGAHSESGGGRVSCPSQQLHTFLTPTLTPLLSVPTDALLLPRSPIVLTTNGPYYRQHSNAAALYTSTTGSVLDLLSDSYVKVLAFSQDTACTVSFSSWT